MPNQDPDNASAGHTSQTAQIRELTIHYLEWPGDGPPILTLHGLASSGHWYRRLAPRLAPDYRIIAPDQRGHGSTTQAPSGYDWQSLAEDAVACSTTSASTGPRCLDIPGAGTLPAISRRDSRTGSPSW